MTDKEQHNHKAYERKSEGYPVRMLAPDLDTDLKYERERNDPGDDLIRDRAATSRPRRADG